jgi:thiamine-phosphate pyrophosphorylase
MIARQWTPKQWMIVVDQRIGAALWKTLRQLPPGTGVLLLRPLQPGDARRLRHIGRTRGLKIVNEEPRAIARVHGIKELRMALLRRTRIVLLSPLYPTPSHPSWKPMPRMRVAALARLARGKAMALGGMNARRYTAVEPFGFAGWAGISAFRT